MRRLCAAAVAAAALCAVLAQFGPATTAATGPVRCGLTTLDGTIQFRDGKLVCGPPQALVVRADLAKAKSGRAGTPLLSFVAMTDFQLPDEESPLRGEFADKCGSDKTAGAFHLYDTLVAALLNSQVRAANDIATGPVTGRPFDFAVQLGDASENQQYNEVRAFIDLLDGGALVDPDSGADGYEGNQARDPYPSPVAGTRLLDLANEPFWAQGLRRPDGSSLPWYTVMGNHDTKVRGRVPNDNVAWRTFARAWVTGSLMVNDLAPDHQQRVCADPTILLDPVFWAEVAAQPGTTKLISADADRRLLDRSEWIAEHARTTGLPAAHGPQIRNRCKDAQGRPLERACYSIDLPAGFDGSPPVHLIMLDTSADEGLDDGNIDQAQWNWLNADLKAHSSSYFTGSEGPAKQTTGNKSSVTVVFSHHTADTATNTVPRADGEAVHTGAELTDLLLRFPNVVAHANGHTHYNRIWTQKRPDGRTGYYEINTSAVAEFPHQSRTVELVDNHDGTLSIFAVNFDAAAPVDPSVVRWAADDTPETSVRFGGAARNINEEHLASIARWLGANDPHSGAAAPAEYAAGAADKNVELVMTHPTGGVKLINKISLPTFRPRTPRFIFRPRFPFQGFPFPIARPVFPMQPPSSFVPPPQVPPPFQAFGTPTRSLGTPYKGAAVQYREIAMIMLAAGAAIWMRRARIRRSQVGL